MSSASVCGLLTATIVLIVVWQIDHSEALRHEQRVRADVVRELARVRARAETAVNTRVFLVLGLKAHVSVNPDMTTQEFADFAALMMAENDGIRSVTSIRDDVIDAVFPLEGNERAIGLNLLKNPDQRAAAEHAKATRRPWLAGPIDLVQGGAAFVSRVPVWETEPGGEPGGGRYWGMVSVLIDRDALLGEIRDPVPDDLEIAVRGLDDRGEPGDFVIGHEAIRDRDPQTVEITLPTGNWQLYGVPIGGWPTAAPGASWRWTAGTMFAVVSALLVFTTLLATFGYRDYSRRLELARADAEKARNEVAVQAEELRTLNESLVRSNEDLDRFASIASHDLQSPLRSIASLVEILRDDYGGQLDERADEYMGLMVGSLNRMQALVQGLLIYARVDSLGRESRPIDLNSVLEDVRNLLRTPIAEAEAEVTGDVLPTVPGDSSQLTRLLQNLVGNAIHYRTPDRPPRVHVSATRENDANWRIEVRDNGIGIPEEHRERVFEMLERLHAEEKYSGSGIGLSVCRRIVERHGGRIGVDSTVGEGSTFWFTLPVADDPVATDS